MSVVDRPIDYHNQNVSPSTLLRRDSRSIPFRSGRFTGPLLLGLLATFFSTGCDSIPLVSTKQLDLMSSPSMLSSPTSDLLLPTSRQQKSQYKMIDGTVAGDGLPNDGSMTMEAYQKIREAKAQNAVVIQVAGDDQTVRVLPLPTGEKSVFCSELLDQTGVLKRFGKVNATLYRPSPESISGVRMDIKFSEDGSMDPTTDYALRPGDRVQIRQRKAGGLQSLVNMAMRR